MKFLVRIGLVAVLVCSVGVSAASVVAAAGGGQIAFTRPMAGGGAELLIANSNGAGQRVVPLRYPMEDFGRGVWSHDGHRLLISNLLRFDDTGELLPFRPATVNPDGSRFRLIDPSGFGFDMFCPSWSPDDSRILCAVGDDRAGIWTIRSTDGSDQRRLTNGTRDIPLGYSPDESQVAFFRPALFDTQGGAQEERWALFSVKPNGKGLRQLTDFGAVMGHEIAVGDWSDDGRTLITSTPDGALITVDVRKQTISRIDLKIDATTYFAFAPSYSPNDKRITFALATDGAPDIYTAKTNGADVRKVTNTADPEFFPDWS